MGFDWYIPHGWPDLLPQESLKKQTLGRDNQESSKVYPQLQGLEIVPSIIQVSLKSRDGGFSL